MRTSSAEFKFSPPGRGTSPISTPRNQETCKPKWRTTLISKPRPFLTGSNHFQARPFMAISRSPTFAIEAPDVGSVRFPSTPFLPVSQYGPIKDFYL